MAGGSDVVLLHWQPTVKARRCLLLWEKGASPLPPSPQHRLADRHYGIGKAPPQPTDRCAELHCGPRFKHSSSMLSSSRQRAPAWTRLQPSTLHPCIPAVSTAPNQPCKGEQGPQPLRGLHFAGNRTPVLSSMPQGQASLGQCAPSHAAPLPSLALGSVLGARSRDPSGEMPTAHTNTLSLPKQMGYGDRCPPFHITVEAR